MPAIVSARKALLLAAYGPLILVGLALVYLGLRGTLPTIADVILPFAYMALILFFVRYQVRAFPGAQPHVTFLWALFVGSITGDTRIGNALAAWPAVAMVCVGGYFFVRGLPNWFRK